MVPASKSAFRSTAPGKLCGAALLDEVSGLAVFGASFPACTHPVNASAATKIAATSILKPRFTMNRQLSVVVTLNLQINKLK